MEVQISGATFSNLLQTLKDCSGDAEGFLLGKTEEDCFEELSDSPEINKKESVTTNIKSFLCINQKCSFYNGMGKVVLEEVEQILKSNSVVTKDVVGWFSFRHYSHHLLSLRDGAVHMSLSTSLPHVIPEKFIFIMFTGHVNMNFSVHTETYTLFQYKRERFTDLPLSITNMAATTGAAMYRNLSSYLHIPKCLEGLAAPYKESLLMSKNNGPPVVSLYRDTVEYMQKLKEDVKSSSEELYDLNSSISRLKLKVEELHEPTTVQTKDPDPDKSDETEEESQPLVSTTEEQPREEIPLIEMSDEPPTPLNVNHHNNTDKGGTVLDEFDPLS